MHLIGVVFDNYRCFEREQVSLSSKYNFSVDYDINISTEELTSEHTEYIKELIIKEIRIYRNTNTKDISYKCIVGKNGSGKSTILSNEYNWNYGKDGYQDKYSKQIFFRIYFDEVKCKVYIYHPYKDSKFNNIENAKVYVDDQLKVVDIMSSDEYKYINQINCSGESKYNNISKEEEVIKNIFKIDNADIAFKIRKFSAIDVTEENYNIKVIKELIEDLLNTRGYYSEKYYAYLKIYLLLMYDDTKIGNYKLFDEDYCEKHIHLLQSRDRRYERIRDEEFYEINKKFIIEQLKNNKELTEKQRELYEVLKKYKKITMGDSANENTFIYNFSTYKYYYDDDNLYNKYNDRFKQLIILNEISDKDDLFNKLKRVSLKKLIKPCYWNDVNYIFKSFLKLVLAENEFSSSLELYASRDSGHIINFDIKEITYYINTTNRCKHYNLAYNIAKKIEKLIDQDNAFSSIFKCELCNTSSGEKNSISMLSKIYSELDNVGGDDKLYSLKDGKKYYYVLLTIDEPDLHLHPEWSRNFVNNLNKIITYTNEKLTESKKILDVQVLLTTHSVFIVSDFKSYELVRLKLEGGKTKVCEKNVSFFGANIYDILKDSFFLNSGVGEFAQEEIKKYIEKLKKLNERIVLNDGTYLELKNELKLIEKFTCEVADAYIKDYFNKTIMNIKEKLRSYNDK